MQIGGLASVRSEGYGREERKGNAVRMSVQCRECRVYVFLEPSCCVRPRNSFSQPSVSALVTAIIHHSRFVQQLIVCLIACGSAGRKFVRWWRFVVHQTERPQTVCLLTRLLLSLKRGMAKVLEAPSYLRVTFPLAQRVCSTVSVPPSHAPRAQHSCF